MENILNQRGFQDNNNNINININKKFSGKTDSNTFSYRSSSKILNEIKELEEEDNNLSNSDDKNNNNEQKDEDKNDNSGRTDIQCWEIDETGLDWKLLFTKEKVDNYPIFYMTQLNDGKIVTASDCVKIYQ